MDNRDQQILDALREAVAQHRLSMETNDLDLTSGLQILASGRTEWQADPTARIELAAAQFAEALAAAKHEAFEYAYEVAQRALDTARS